MAKKIIDVSHHNGVIDWNQTKNHIDGVIIACGYGSDITSQDDKQYFRNVKECERLKIPYGVYLYSYAQNLGMVDSSVNHILRLVQGHKPRVVYYDIEEASCASISAQAHPRFESRIKAAGFTPGLYTYKSRYDEYGMNRIAKSRLWIASYGNNDNVADPWENPNVPGTAGWQYTSTDRIPGIATNVDVSLFYNSDFDKIADPAIMLPTLPKGSMYRLWCYPNKHLWTSSKQEAQCLVSQGWKYEGNGWKAPATGDPVYRLFHPAVKVHMLTSSAVERDHLSKSGWRYEGIACYSETDPAKQVPVYRLSYGAAHLYTTSTHEVEGLVRAGWTDEHVAFFGTK